MKLLIVDDSNIMRRAIEKYLSAFNLEIVGNAGDGESALAIFSETLPSVPACDRTTFLMLGWVQVPYTIHPKQRALSSHRAARACPPERDNLSGGHRHRLVPTGWCAWPLVTPPVQAPDAGRRTQNAPVTQECPIASGHGRAQP